MPNLQPDLFIVGAGPVGCVVAERAASLRGWTSLVIDRRDHPAGNCHDRIHESGVLIHDYGPHYFRTSDESLVRYLSRFTDWTPANYVVKSEVNGRLFPFPVNLTTLEMFFGRPLSREAAEALIIEKALPIAHPSNSEEFVLSRLGRELYEAFYEGYTRKQWGSDPAALEPSVCGRIPVRLDRRETYVDHPFQQMPRDGFTALFSRMLSHPKIELALRTDFRDLRGAVRPKVATVYCGPADDYFDHRLGRLPWRSLRFQHQTRDQDFVQPCVQINYPSLGVPYTRSVEIKHVTGQRHPKTVVTLETPAATGDPYYPVPSPASRSLFSSYAELIRMEEEKEFSPVYFSGRLATYRYLNTDEAILEALQTFSRIEKEWEKRRSRC